MKRYKKLLLLALPTVLCGTSAMAQEQAKTADCKKCTEAIPAVTVFHYIVAAERHYVVGNCVPGSDVFLYTTPSGGSVAAGAIADDKGEAHFIVGRNVPVAFAINHSRPNEQGIAGTGKVMPVKEAGLVIDNVDVTKINNEVQLNWTAGVTDGDWAFTIQRSTDNILFTDIATVDARQVKTTQGYAWTDKDADAKSVLFYRVEARNTTGDKGASPAVAVKVSAKPVFAVQPTLFDNSVQVTVPADKLPATYTVTDITGRITITGGVINATGQNIRLNLASGTYALRVTNKLGKSSVQLIVRK
jgi:hypothetical protein